MRGTGSVPALEALGTDLLPRASKSDVTYEKALGEIVTTRHRILLSVLVLVVLPVSACGGTSTGVVTGIAYPCVGPHRTAAQLANIPVRVTIRQRSEVIARQIVRGSHTYRFAVPSGQYVVSSRTSGPVSIMLHAGEVRRANLLSFCK
jgi:hypothetical protein